MSPSLLTNPQRTCLRNGCQDNTFQRDTRARRRVFGRITYRQKGDHCYGVRKLEQLMDLLRVKQMYPTSTQAESSGGKHYVLCTYCTIEPALTKIRV